jgi:hypothetical protein
MGYNNRTRSRAEVDSRSRLLGADGNWISWGWQWCGAGCIIYVGEHNTIWTRDGAEEGRGLKVREGWGLEKKQSQKNWRTNSFCSLILCMLHPLR